MYVVNMDKLDLSDEQLAALDKFIHENIPSGMSDNDDKHCVGFDKLNDLKMWQSLHNVEHLQRSVGSLGSGNHFIELNKSESGDVYLVIHTGSRNLGQQVCKFYQSIAVEDCNVKSEELKAKTEQLIAEYKDRYKC